MIKNSLYKIFHEVEYQSIKHESYFYVYEELFSKYRNKTITFVEIGVLNGGSLFMWRKFFGNDARIIGIDLNPEAIIWKDHGFEIYIGDQENPSFWSKIAEEIGEIDILLDDGGHTYGQQILTTCCALSLIRDGGIIVVEDTHTSYMEGFGPKKFSFINYVKKEIDRLNMKSIKLSKLKSKSSEIWSIECFDSIVVFKINRALANIKSKMIVNQGVDGGLKDYRDAESSVVLYAQKIGEKIRNPTFRELVKYPYIKLYNIVAYFRGLKLWIYFRD
jgi:hypothetical protein